MVKGAKSRFISYQTYTLQKEKAHRLFVIRYENKKFILEWYKFIKALTFRLKFVRDEKEIAHINEFLLDNFYRVKIDNDFYKSFEELLPKVKNKLGII